MKKHIVCFGDSNTHGYCAMNDGRFDENERWTCFLQKNLGEDYLVLEEGLSGRTTCFNDPLFEGLSGLDYIYPCLMSHEPVDLLVIMLGTNDTKERFGFKADEMLAMRFAVMHNLYFYNTLMARIRAAIEAGEYEAFRKTYTTMLDTRI